ncbi:MAG: autotransporter-associated beta strand repeat-containing protein [Kiritimatiellae bacterium]|nr:autotransporter-associated beta strand repeat-containing protein [Kiritimatiellia bacterium]
MSISVPWLCGTGGSIMDQGVAAGTSTLTVNQSVSTMFAGAISNGTSRVIALVKSGAGTLALAGQNNYSGATAVNAGKLIGVTGGACGSSVITVAGNATNGVRVASYGGQWACAGLTHNGGATALEFDFGRVPPCDWAAPLQVNGDLTINGAVGVVICNGVWGNTGTYPLVSYTGTLSGGVPAAPAAMPSGLVATLVSNTGEKRIDLVVTAVPAVVSPPAFVWSRLVGGKADGVWDEAVNWSPAGVPDGIDAVADFSTLDITASSVVTIASPRTVGTLLVSDIVPSGQTWTLDGGADKHLTLASSVGVPMIDVTNTEVFLGGFKGTNGLVKSGNGVLALYGNSYNNSLSGPIFVNSGALGTVNGLSFKYITGDIIVAAGASFVANGGNDYQLKSFNNIYLSGTGGTPSGYVTAQTPDGHYPSEPVPLGALDIHGSAFIEGVITLVTDSRITHGFNDGRINGVVRALEPGRNLELVTTTGGGHWGLAVNGRLNLGTGGLTLNSKVAGVSSGSNGARFFLNAANSYSGGTVLTNYANVRLGNVGALGSGGVTLYPDTCLNLFGQSVVIGGLSGTGGCITDTNGVAGTTTLTLNHSGATTFAGEISNGPIRTIALVKNGVGALTLSGTNTYTGATAVSNGTLTVNGALSSSAVTVCTGAAFGAGGTGVVGRAMLGGALTFQDSSALLVDLEPPLADAVVVSGDAVIGIGVEVRLSCNQDKAGSWQIIKTTAGTVQGSDPVLVGGLQGTTLTRTDTAIWLTIPPEGVILIVR